MRKGMVKWLDKQLYAEMLILEKKAFGFSANYLTIPEKIVFCAIKITQILFQNFIIICLFCSSFLDITLRTAYLNLRITHQNSNKLLGFCFIF